MFCFFIRYPIFETPFGLTLSNPSSQSKYSLSFPVNEDAGGTPYNLELLNTNIFRLRVFMYIEWYKSKLILFILTIPIWRSWAGSKRLAALRVDSTFWFLMCDINHFWYKSNVNRDQTMLYRWVYSLANLSINSQCTCFAIFLYTFHFFYQCPGPNYVYLFCRNASVQFAGLCNRSMNEKDFRTFSFMQTYISDSYYTFKKNHSFRRNLFHLITPLNQSE